MRDRDRPLTARGRVDAQRVGDYVAHHSLIPDLAIVSPARRTRETWAPTRPPISACDDDDGSPKYQVSRFQPIAPISAANTTTRLARALGRVDDPGADGLGHLGAEERADEVEDGGHGQGHPRGQRAGRDRGRDGVRGVVEAVGVVEAHRHDDDDDDRRACPRGQDSLTAMVSTVLATSRRRRPPPRAGRRPP